MQQVNCEFAPVHHIREVIQGQQVQLRRARLWHVKEECRTQLHHERALLGWLVVPFLIPGYLGVVLAKESTVPVPRCWNIREPLNQLEWLPRIT